MKFILALLLSLLLYPCLASDSLRTETVNGKFVIVHKVEAGQTFYSIARRYKITVDELKAANPSLTQPKTGIEIHIPIKTQNQNPPLASTSPKEEARGTDGEEGTIHKVKPGETLFRISKMYNVSVAQINEANQLGAGGIKVGQELLIPQKIATNSSTPANYTTPKATPTTQIQSKVEKKTSATGYPAISEIGMAKLDESLSSDFYVVLHKTALIGTLLLIKNKETGTMVHAKVSGPAKTGDLLVLNKKTFEKLEAKSNTLAVEIFYTPED